MATTRKAVKAEEPTQEEILQENGEAEEQQVTDPWSIMETVVVPRRPKGEDQQFYVCVNDRRFVIPANGKPQEMPKPVAGILQEAIEAEYAAEDYADHIPNNSPDGIRYNV